MGAPFDWGEKSFYPQMATDKEGALAVVFFYLQSSAAICG
jgi:hypothetical protein